MSDTEVKAAANKFREFHLKEPDRVLKLNNVSIPNILYPVGFAVQISYMSNKWQAEDKFESYIHYWEHPTVLYITKDMLGDYALKSFRSDQTLTFPRYDNDEPQRLTWLGYAIDLNYADDDRSKIKLNPGYTYVRHLNPQSPAEVRKMAYTETIEFDSDPESSQEYVCCSPDGKLVFVVSNKYNEVFAFLNKNCKVTTHGIEG
jgi:hypothetical protein